ncbi:MAG: hypothetical protein AAF804_00180 [Bacteroidota bacterium]
MRYAPQKAETIAYEIKSGIEAFPEQSGELVISGNWPGARYENDYILGNHWYTDRSDEKEI